MAKKAKRRRPRNTGIYLFYRTGDWHDVVVWLAIAGLILGAIIGLLVAWGAFGKP